MEITKGSLVLDMVELILIIEDFRKIEYFLDETSLEKLTKETLEIGNEIMNDREEIIKYINQQDDIDIDVSDLM